MNKVLSVLLVLTSLVSFSGYASDHGQRSGQVQGQVGGDSGYYDTREGSYPGMITNHCDQLSSGINEDCVASLPITSDYCDARVSEDCY